MRTQKRIKCPYCGGLMYIDDVDYNFPGNFDNYWLCPECGATATELIRHGTRIAIKAVKGEEQPPMEKPVEYDEWLKNIPYIPTEEI